MKKFFRMPLLILIMAVFACSISSCTIEIEPGDPSSKPDDSVVKERLILIYAVAANNLQLNLGYDKDEILAVAPRLDLHNNTVLVYSVVTSGKCVLEELDYNTLTKKYEFSEVTTFNDLPLSTSEERINDVITYVDENFNYKTKGLVLWSHADGWVPWFGGSTPDENKRKSFGWDNYENNTYKTNINDLAKAIPEGVFDFIWFDCCYMANIETVYQLREKADYIIGSVLEIANDGMPYNLTLPYLLKENPDYENAAYAFYKSYNDFNVAVSVSIIKTSELENLASVSREIIETSGKPTNLSTIQTYQRLPVTVKFYDMKQLLDSYSGITRQQMAKLSEAFDKAVIYKRISAQDFDHQYINVDDYSGLSMHNFTDSETKNDNFYKELDWYLATH